jgi:hypothetical protein
MFLPSGKEYWVPWVLGLALVPILSALGAPAFPAPNIAYDQTRCLALAGLLGCLLLFDGAILWVGLRTQFLTWETGRRTFGVTYLVLLSVYILIWGTVLLLRHTVRFVGVPGDMESLGVTLHTMTIAAAGLGPALAITALWKFEEPGFASVRLARKTALTILDAASPTSPMSADGLSTLRGALASISRDGATSLPRAARQEDRQLLRAWIGAADAILAATSDLAIEDLPQTTALDTVYEQRETLRRTR